MAILYKMRQAARVASCKNDIRMLHYAFEKYATQHDGLLPPLSATRGNRTGVRAAMRRLNHSS